MEKCNLYETLLDKTRSRHNNIKQDDEDRRQTMKRQVKPRKYRTRLEMTGHDKKRQDRIRKETARQDRTRLDKTGHDRT